PEGSRGGLLAWHRPHGAADGILCSRARRLWSSTMGLGTDHAPAAPRPRRLGLRRCARGASSPSRIALSVVRSEPLVPGDHPPAARNPEGEEYEVGSSV